MWEIPVVYLSTIRKPLRCPRSAPFPIVGCFPESSSLKGSGKERDLGAEGSHQVVPVRVVPLFGNGWLKAAQAYKACFSESAGWTLTWGTPSRPWQQSSGSGVDSKPKQRCQHVVSSSCIHLNFSPLQAGWKIREVHWWECWGFPFLECSCNTSIV